MGDGSGELLVHQRKKGNELGLSLSGESQSIDMAATGIKGRKQVQSPNTDESVHLCELLPLSGGLASSPPGHVVLSYEYENNEGPACNSESFQCGGVLRE